MEHDDTAVADTTGRTGSGEDLRLDAAGDDALHDALDYTVALESYTGPLDLLLHLIKINEVEIADIPISHITDQYLSYLETLKEVDVNLAGEFLLMAATLLEIKSRMLLERSEDRDEDQEDPRLELVRQLLEYKKFKERSQILARRAKRRALSARRAFDEIPTRTVGDETAFWQDVSVWSLFRAFEDLRREVGLDQTHTVVYDDKPVREFMREIYDRLKREQQLKFHALFAEPPERIAMVGAFIAVLELIRLRHLTVDQPPEEDIRLVFNPEGGELDENAVLDHLDEPRPDDPGYAIVPEDNGEDAAVRAPAGAPAPELESE